MTTALEVAGLRKEYKTFVLEDVSFALPQGYIMGLVGPNGAGKTTTIKLIMNLARRKAGTVRVLGLDNILQEAQVKARVGFVPEVPFFYEDVTLRDLKSAVSLFYPAWDEKLCRSLMAEFGLPLNKAFKKLSHGMKQKFAIALALSHRPDLLVMDEPTTGLDPVFRRELLDRLSAHIQDERKSVLFSTHITSDLERTADFITFLNGGRVVFSLPRDEVRESWAVVKGGPELLDGPTGRLFKGVRKTAFGVEALTSDVKAVHSILPLNATIDKASIEDIMVFFNQGALDA